MFKCRIKGRNSFLLRTYFPTIPKLLNILTCILRIYKIKNPNNSLGYLAERTGFEPAKAFTPYTLSKRAR